MAIMTDFFLSQKSLDNLKGIHSDLVIVVKNAIKITKVDFMVGEGLRSLARQNHLVKQGKSKTMNSRHITGHAVDLWAVVGGKISWDWQYYDDIASAMRQSANVCQVPIVWGAVWDKRLNDIENVNIEPKNYVLRRKKLGLKAFSDGVHFELCRKQYP